MNTFGQNHKRLNQFLRISLGIGVAALILSLPKALYQSAQFFGSYLFAYLFWLELTLGSMAMLMIYCITGGDFGVVTRRILESSMCTIYLMVVLFIPIFVGAKKIYPWADPLKLNLKEFAHKALYFDFSFFCWRSVFYLVSWMIVAYLLSHYLNKKSLILNSGLTFLSVVALLFLGLSITWASIDWQMSLDPLWYSTIYGMLFAVGQALGAWAFTLLVLKILTYFEIPLISIPKKVELDLGNILLTLVILWTYLSFMQYLIVWSGNLPDEVTWFNKRMHHGWQWLMLILYLFQFAAPFLFLLFRDLKTSRIGMIIITSLILVIRILDRYWMIMPSFEPSGISFTYVDITLLIGLGGIWVSMFLFNLKKHGYFAFDDSNWPKHNEA